MKGIEGVRLRLRLVEITDAQFIFSLRTNSNYNAHLSSVSGKLSEQRSWLAEYKRRETAALEYYYVIERKIDDMRCGLVRIYNIEEDAFTWGSWVLAQGKPPKAAYESAMLSFHIGFHALNRRKAVLDVRKDNERAIAFYRRFGMNQTHEDELNLYFEYLREHFDRAEPTFHEILAAGAEA
ncbi:conserved hypothetical protein [Altererythrobacter sp. B11]|uniref:GNAT family N-acetyltransferase n=1 Tax=Altererythrobacter sp. B11 TaxID=2060312 RepID=UPI000DC6D9AA|nr:GNAT family N-acetyltransferase [Altererythrobacter sp. B11]BBC73986.1 conserved hypothetical protein [Altererythrobacter sp. B11]